MTQPFVRSDVQAFIDLMKANPRPELRDEILPAMRAMAPQGMARIDLPLGEIAVTRDVVMRGPEGEIRLRMFDARANREPGPALVFYHGGGFVLCSIDTHASICAEIARQLDLPVISVDYRLAPEHPWPAAPDDAEAAARWIADNGTAFDRAITGLVLCGDSAGANLTIVTALALRDRPAAVPVLVQFPIYPNVDPFGRYPSNEAFGEGYLLDASETRWFAERYKPQPGHWRAAPIHADQAGMPATLLLTAGLDPLRDGSRAYAAKTIAAGVPTTYREATGTVHGFLTYRRVIPSAQNDFVAALAVARTMIREAEAQRVAEKLAR